MKKTSFSVVIPTISSFSEIKSTLNSINKAKRDNELEVILVDDCSGNDLSQSSQCIGDTNYKYIRNTVRCGPGISRKWRKIC